jgi:hypothetical protein
VPQCCSKVHEIAKHRKNQRLPILAYTYKGSESVVPLWITSSYLELKEINKDLEGKLLQGLDTKGNLQVFVAETKNSKYPDESVFKTKVSVNYLKLESNEELRASEMRLIEVFLFRKKPFILEVLNSGWYRYVSNVLQSVHQIVNALMNEKAVVIRCDSGYDKSLVLASLVQVVLDPYFRTIKGFEHLIMRMFVHYGHPFASRLGERKACR